MKTKIFLCFIYLLSTKALASPPPCSKWEFIVRSHEVQAYEKKDGTKVSESTKKDYCKNKFPEVENWQERFTDGGVSNWPNKTEKFKSWTQLEKETVLKYLNEQPNTFRNLPGITFLRGIKSIHNKNPGASVKRLNAIALYDEFFASGRKSQVISHEFGHLIVHELRMPVLQELVSLMGWREDSRTRDFLRIRTVPLLKPTSNDLSEDIANHFEIYLHTPQLLLNNNKPVFDFIQKTMRTSFKLEN